MKIKVTLLTPVLCAMPLERHVLPMKRGHKLVQTLSFLSLWELWQGACLSLGVLTGVPLSLSSCSITQALPKPPRELPYRDHPANCLVQKNLVPRKGEMISQTFHTFRLSQKCEQVMIPALKSFIILKENQTSSKCTYTLLVLLYKYLIACFSFVFNNTFHTCKGKLSLSRGSDFSFLLFPIYKFPLMCTHNPISLAQNE